MKRAKTRPPQELLAAYADGGVNDDERAVVEQYLADNPGAKQELESIRDLVARAREAVPQPMEEPSWSGMARRIVEMCEAETQAEEAKKQDRPVRRRLARWFRPRHSLGLAAAAIAAIILFAVLRSNEGTETAPQGEPSIATRPQPGHPPAPDTRPGVDWDQVEQLLDEGLDDNVDDSLDDSLDDDRAINPDATADSDTGGDLEYATGPGLDLFAEPDYMSWLDDLSAAELDELDDLLREAQAG